jgi:hypothetical protein
MQKKPMERFSLQSPRMKVLVPAVLFTALLLFGLGVFMGLRAKASLSADLASKAESMAAFLERAGIPYVLKLDYASLEGIVARAVKDPEVEFVVYYDAQGNVLTRTGQRRSVSENALFKERELKDPSSQAVIGRLMCAFSRPGLESQSRQDLVTLTAALGGGGLMVVMFLVCVIRRRTRSSDPATEEIVLRSKPAAIVSPSPSFRPHEVAPLGKADLE